MPSSQPSGQQQLLQDKLAIVTGASRGIGKAICEAFAQQGARVAAVARTPYGPGSLETPGGIVPAHGGEVLPVQCDVSNERHVKRMVDIVLKRFGRVDILVNNAGVGIWKDIFELTPDDWDVSVAVNLRGPFLTCKFVVPAMIEHGGGNIINVSSSMALRYSPKDGVYSSTKAALNRFTLNLAEDIKKHNIAVNAYYPGYIDTDMVKEDPTGTWPPTADPPEIVGPSLVWLAQQTASEFTGQIVWRREFGKKWGEGE